MDKKSSIKLYYAVETASGANRMTSKTINFVKNDATKEDIEVVKNAFATLMDNEIKKVEKVTVEVL